MRIARLCLDCLLIAPRTTLGRSELVHLGHPLFELDVLTFLVAVPLLLHLYVSIRPSILEQGHVEPGLVVVDVFAPLAATAAPIGGRPTSHFQGR